MKARHSDRGTRGVRSQFSEAYRRGQYNVTAVLTL